MAVRLVYCLPLFNHCCWYLYIVVVAAAAESGNDYTFILQFYSFQKNENELYKNKKYIEKLQLPKTVLNCTET